MIDKEVIDLESQLAAVTAERDAFARAIDSLNGNVLRVEAERYESLLKRCATALEMTPTKWRNGEHITLPSRIKAAIDAARAK